MIFVTVGHQMPFDRLVMAVDAWAGRAGRADLFAQVGDAKYEPSHMEWVRSMSGQEFRDRVADAELVVAHAGTGTILTALELGTPILVMPRFAQLRETRNDHQIATARRFHELGKVSLAKDEQELSGVLDRLAEIRSGPRIPAEASAELIDVVRGFIFGLNQSI
ncbi:MAG: hypothetical protein LAT64_00130 [Phycisphaerales bacterium]|nr:hypothetical protein [Planctomycetota bacterium]MCH8507169.1 hypothetical protein [Phycisphaerales bacterium]